MTADLLDTRDFVLLHSIRSCDNRLMGRAHISYPIPDKHLSPPRHCAVPLRTRRMSLVVYSTPLSGFRMALEVQDLSGMEKDMSSESGSCSLDTAGIQPE